MSLSSILLRELPVLLTPSLWPQVLLARRLAHPPLRWDTSCASEQTEVKEKKSKSARTVRVLPLPTEELLNQTHHVSAACVCLLGSISATGWKLLQEPLPPSEGPRIVIAAGPGAET